MNSDREARKKALEAARQRLAFRKKQKEQLQLLRQQKAAGGGNGLEDSNLRKNDYGQKLVNDTKQMISDWSSTKEKEEEKLEEDNAADDGKEDRTQTVPGPRADLNIVHNVNVVDLMKRSR